MKDRGNKTGYSHSLNPHFSQFFNEFIDHLLGRHLAINSISTYSQALRYLFGFLIRRNLTPTQLDRKALCAFAKDLVGSGYSRTTIEHHLYGIKQFYIYKQKQLKVDPDFIHK